MAKINLFALLVTVAPLAGCHEIRQLANSPDAIPAGWQSACIGRVEVSLPAETQFAEGKIAFSSPYAFNGVSHTHIWGEVKWGDAEINETARASDSSLQAVFKRGKADLRSPEQYRQEVEDAREVVAQWSKELSQADLTTGDDSIKKVLERKTQILKELEFGSKVTGVAKTVSKNEFAIRPFGTQYAVGYWDHNDQRIRTFKGRLRNLSPESPEAAAQELRRWKQIYSPRIPSQIPTKPGFCSTFGFFDESSGADTKAMARIPFRLQEHPNLLFVLTVEPSNEDGPSSIFDSPDMALGRAQLDLIGVKARHGTDKVQILGSPGRVYAQEYGHNCAAKDDCRPADQAYEIHAETFGEAGRLDHPHLTLYMVAANSDEYKAKRKAEPDNPSYNTPQRAALKGHVPPPYKVGREIFDHMLRSIRIRPGAVATNEKTVIAKD